MDTDKFILKYLSSAIEERISLYSSKDQENIRNWIRDDCGCDLEAFIEGENGKAFNLTEEKAAEVMELQNLIISVRVIKDLIYDSEILQSIQKTMKFIKQNL